METRVNVYEWTITINVIVDRLKRFSEADADVIMQQISKQTGKKWCALKINGAWVISCTSPEDQTTWRPVFGHRGENVTVFTEALAAATGRKIVQRDGRKR